MTKSSLETKMEYVQQ